MNLIPAIKRNWYVFLTYLVRRKRKPFLASYKLTYRCNLRCAQCPFPYLENPNPSFELVKATLDRLYDRGNRLVIFEGGEPMLWADQLYTTADVINYAREKFMAVGITTNGTFPLEIRPDILWVSIDGLEKTHNYLRGKPIFEDVISHIQASSHPKIYAHITVNQINAPEIPKLIPYLSNIVKGITVQFYYPYANNDQLYLKSDLREKTLEKLIELKRAGFPILNSTASLGALKKNTWACEPWLIDNANPDGSIRQGCYLAGRTDIDCKKCGFSPYTEASHAYHGSLQAALAGIKIFFQ